ncbi:MAG: hypothetical protein LUG89_04270, partial [Methanosphaera sp.]|nr:hypothetical protein [Methanosphaera sp.]
DIYYNIIGDIMTFNEVILGSSPFTFSPHFGHRTRLYELDFQDQPENIAQILNCANSMGVSRIHLRNSKELLRAFNLSLDEGFKWSSIGQTSCDNLKQDMELFSKYGSDTIIIDGNYVDSNIQNPEILIEKLDLISDNDFIPAIETRTPFKNLEIIRESELMNHFETIMIPLNFYGYMMDCNFLNNENKSIISELVSILDKKIIANRTLAAGILQPKEAYEFISKIDYVDSVCVGIAKVSEAEETLGIINEYKS